MHALCPSHRQSRRQQTKYDCMSVTLTSDHSKIFFAAVTAAFAAPPPGRTATAAPHWPLQCRCTAARSRRTATAAQRHCRRRLVGDSPSRVSVWHGQARRVPPRQHCRCTQAASAGEPAPLHCRRTASAESAVTPHRVRTDSAVPPLPRHPVCRRAALPRVPAVPPHCGALES